MVENKSDQISIKHKEEGNKLFKRNKFKDALICYNKGLCYAKSNEYLAFLYGNRSAVFYTIGRYDWCLENIKLAIEHGYPAHRMEVLKDREERCKESQKEIIEDPVFNANYFKKLSHPPNPKIPFIVDCLELRKTKIGYGVFTTRDLKPGDIIAIEDQNLTVMHKTGQYKFCCNCLSYCMSSLLPCLKSASLMYCSKSCRDKIYQKFSNLNLVLGSDREKSINVDKLLIDAQEAFGGRDDFVKFINENDLKKMKKTVFDYDWSSADDFEKRRNFYECIFSLNANWEFQSFIIEPSAELFGKNRSLINAAKHLSHIYCKYGTFYGEDEGKCLYAFVSLIKHSCVANIRSINGHNKSILHVFEPIKAGEELTHNFLLGNEIDLHERFMRRKFIELTRGYECDCYYCVNDININNLKMGTDSNIDMAINKSRSLKFEAPPLWKMYIEQLKSNWAVIEDYSKHHPKQMTQNIYKLLSEIERILQSMTSLYIFSSPLENQLASL